MYVCSCMSGMSQQLSKACMRVSFGAASISSLSFLKLTGCCVFFFDCTALGNTVILRAVYSLDEGPETGGFSCVLGVVGFISIFMH